eukprot:TRINITY_DN733_c0_g1_i1.p1 TRINITY_DN733_c0_g1~~TRINITY_DN733_c0_g1_i1.p1  ORF type:complete len:359 (-),score=88.95 TRINITY_DN733_c0_g1_i1:123-1199(-)
MGACTTKLSDEDRKAIEANKRIERDLARRKKEMFREVKLLLLGTGASGKSTVAKQMQIIYLNGWGEKEKTEFKPLIYANLVENMQCLLRGVAKLNLTISSDHTELAEEILDIQFNVPDFELSKRHYEGIKSLWQNDQAIAAAFKRRNEFQLSDSAFYFFNNIDKYADMPTYNVTDEDILRVRKRTTGIIETDFTVGDLHFRMVDVGGQRNERKKWIHCFEDVTAILFVASLAEYDLSLEEDDSTNRMRESLHLFEETVNNEWFSNTPVILFLNKNDLFQTKALVSDLGDYFAEYIGGKDVDAARKFISDMYCERNGSNKRQRDFYVHPTTATDTKNILTVFDAVQDIFLHKAISEFNL